MTLRGLVVDFGGVLTTSVSASVAAFAEEEDVDLAELGDLLTRAYAVGADDAVTALETGAMTVEEFEQSVVARLRKRSGEPLEADGFVARMFGRLEIDHEMVAAVRRLHDRGVRTALLSNTWGVEQAMHEEVLELFDATVLSGKVGLRKPNPEIYALAVDELGLQAGECVFVDDFQVNVEAAERAGLRGIVHVRTEETVQQIEELFAG